MALLSLLEKVVWKALQKESSSIKNKIKGFQTDKAKWSGFKCSQTWSEIIQN
jgi:hypothetical protein